MKCPFSDALRGHVSFREGIPPGKDQWLAKIASFQEWIAIYFHYGVNGFSNKGLSEFTVRICDKYTKPAMFCDAFCGSQLDDCCHIWFLYMSTWRHYTDHSDMKPPRFHPDFFFGGCPIVQHMKLCCPIPVESKETLVNSCRMKNVLDNLCYWWKAPQPFKLFQHACTEEKIGKRMTMYHWCLDGFQSHNEEWFSCQHKNTLENEHLEPKKGDLEDDFLFSIGWFLGSSRSFSGV